MISFPVTSYRYSLISNPNYSQPHSQSPITFLIPSYSLIPIQSTLHSQLQSHSHTVYTPLSTTVSFPYNLHSTLDYSLIPIRSALHSRLQTHSHTVYTPLSATVSFPYSLHSTLSYRLIPIRSALHSRLQTHSHTVYTPLSATISFPVTIPSCSMYYMYMYTCVCMYGTLIWSEDTITAISMCLYTYTYNQCISC